MVLTLELPAFSYRNVYIGSLEKDLGHYFKSLKYPFIITSLKCILQPYQRMEWLAMSLNGRYEEMHLPLLVT